ncbi:MAG: 3-hydroxyacyl-CoA dehydrogenase NAD-binding domain-containing protein [Burkholderiaceae bacterium]
MSVVESLSKQGVCTIVIDNPPVNATSQAVRAGLSAAVRAAIDDPDTQVIILACAGKTFVAGADIREFGQPPLDPHLSVVIDEIERSPKPVVAAVQGTALGGGFELALGCHYRILKADAQVGFPECSLGIIPGAGGVARISRLAEPRLALELLLFGHRLTGKTAHEAGIADRVVAGEIRAEAEAFARELAASNTQVRRTRDRPAEVADAALLKEVRDRLARQARGQPAPLACLALYEAEAETDFDASIERSREVFRELVISPEARALRHAFFAERVATRSKDLPDPRPRIESAGVVDAGTMGTGIAMCLLDAGLAVVLVDSDSRQLAASRSTIENTYDRSVQKGRIDPATRDQRLGRLKLSGQIQDLAETGIVIEAVFEDMAVKQAVFAEIDRVVRPDTIIASNTSFLDVNRLGEGVSHPERVVGMHFFSPAHLMPLLENVRTRQSAPQVLADIQALGRRLKKVPVLVGVSDGFVGNRMLAKRTREAYFLLEEGALPDQIDRVLRDFGFPMGQFQLNDLAGLDVAWRNRQSRLDRLSEREAGITILDEIVALGRLGQKTGAGFYRYDAERRRSVDPAITELIVDQSRRRGVVRRTIDDQEILERCLYAMINEAAWILEDGVASRPEEIDTIWLNGYGFPRYRGGPLFYADSVGIRSIVARIQHYAGFVGDAYWRLAPLLEQMARQDKGFYNS